MSDGLFSTYRTGENRVTASTLAVLRSLSIGRMERLIGALLENVDFSLLSLRNQTAVKGDGSIPDAEISTSCRILIETKIQRNAVRSAQLREHLRRLDRATEAAAYLLVLTPDDARPREVDELADARVSWTSFAALDQAIDELLADKMEVVSEREAYLLRELQFMLQEEGLLAVPCDTVVVAARQAWSEYQQFAAYVCQPNRSFQRVNYVGFYSSGAIHPFVPAVLSVHDRVIFEHGRHSGDLGHIVDAFLAHRLRAAGAEYKVFLLTPPANELTIHLRVPVPNDLRSTSGRASAFTQSQRYVRSSALQNAVSTSELVET